MENNFKVGDIVTVFNALGEYDMRVVEVWCDTEPRCLLLTDVDGLTFKTNPILVYDCKLKYRPEKIIVKDYRTKEQKTYTGSLIRTDLYKNFRRD